MSILRDIGPRIEAVIFDLDGVLTLSSPIHAQAFADTLAGAGVDNFRYAPYAGMRTRDVVRAISRERGLDWSEGEIARLAEEKTARALALLKERNPVVPGALAALRALGGSKRLALASSASRESVAAFLDANPCRLDAVVTGGEVKQAKPSPEIFLAAAQRLGVEPEACLVVEDAVSGVTAARAAGMLVCGIATTVSAEELRAAGALLCIDTLTDLLELHESLPASPGEPGAPGKRVLLPGELHPYLAPSHDPSRWTALIPAAGRGTRLGYDKPKILFPLAGRSILEHLLRLAAPLCSRVVLVLSPEGAPVVRPELERLLPGRGAVAIQPEPAGMGDAIARGLPEVATPRVMIVWGDQAALRPETLERGMRLLDGPLPPAAVCPTVWRTRPYIHFARGADGRLDRVLQAREGDPMPAEGESDAGLFFFDAPTLRRRLGALAGSPESVGARTGESNFLPLLALMDRGGDAVLCPRIVTAEESAGVNSREDARYLESILAGRTGKES